MIIPNSNYWGVGQESFIGLLKQLEDPNKGESGASDVAFRNLELQDQASLESAGAKMKETSSLAAKMESSSNPTLIPEAYHLTLGFYKGEVENLGASDLFKITDEFLGKRGLGSHERVYLLHEGGHHPHVHCVVNRVGPEKKLWEKDGDERDYSQNLETALELTKRSGFSTVPDPTLGSIDSWRIQRSKRTGKPPLGDAVLENEVLHFENAATWRELQHFIGKSGFFLRRKGTGASVTDGDWVAPLSDVRRMWSFPILDDHFPGEFTPISEDVLPERPLVIKGEKGNQEILMSKTGRAHEPMYLNYYYNDTVEGIGKMPGRPFDAKIEEASDSNSKSR